MLTLEEERQIVSDVLAGKKEEYAKIVREYQSTVAALGYRLTGGRIDADEITSRVFIELYTSLPRFRFESKLSTFIYRITVNMVGKLNTTNQRYVVTDFNENIPDADSLIAIEEQQYRDEKTRKLHEAIGTLKYEQRTALILHVFEKFSYQAIAEVMQVSVAKVESLIFRSKKNLRKVLEKTLNND